MSFRSLLKLPDIRNISDLDDPSTTLLHSKIIKGKPFLKKLYEEFYNEFNESIKSDPTGTILIEIGSGGGFIKEVMPEVVTSDVIKAPNVDLHFSVLDMPFKENSIDGIFMIDVMHHINDQFNLFNELDRTLKIGGRIVMIEPANTLWSRFIYKNFHHEPFDPSGGWTFTKTGPLSSANGAIPWIIFCRDRVKFEREFPTLKIRKMHVHTPVRYLISGGLSMRQLLPTALYLAVKGIEFILSPLNRYLGMFMTVELEKVA